MAMAPLHDESARSEDLVLSKMRIPPRNPNALERICESSKTDLYHLLEDAANTSTTKVIVYPPGKSDAPISRSYKELLTRVTGKASLISRIDGVAADSKILLHFDQHSQNIEWFWSTIIAGLLPVMSPPLVNNISQRRTQLIHLHELLQVLIILTSKKLEPDFLGLNQPLIRTIESLDDRSGEHHPRSVLTGVGKQRHDSAVLMLTSGSTGNAKAVNLTSGQILSSMRGKSAIHGTKSTDIFLNWIGMDHVACLTEIHLHAMSLGAEQIHVHATDLLENPLYFLELISKHRVTYTFAPNFFLAALRRSLETTEHCDFDLSCLRIIVTGGEAALVENCRALTQCLRRFRIPENRDVIRPGFGMTETCAGSIYGKSCPTYDMKYNLEFASLGSCMPGINMRIMGDNGATASINQIGDLHVSGPVVFKNYYNNTQATLDSFTEDGWFITGDRAALDANGCLSLTGRLKDNIIINGIKHFPHEIETALEEALISGATASYYVVFSHRPKLSETETYCVVYLPNYNLNDDKARAETADAILQSCIMAVGARPYRVIPLELSQLPKTSLGKISRAKIRTAFESGLFTEAQDANDFAIRNYPETPLNFSLALEARRRMVPALPKEYLGNVIFHCPIISDFSTVTSSSVPLHAIAKLFREAVTRYDSAKIHGVIGLIDSMAKATDLLMRVHDDPMRGLAVTSWVDTGLYQLEWGGGLGKAESVRLPGVTLPGGTPVCGIFPRMPDGGLEILVNLEEESIEALREDEEVCEICGMEGNVES